MSSISKGEAVLPATQTRLVHQQRRWAARANKYSVYIALAVLFVFNLVATEGFASVFTIQNLLFSVAPIVMIALGQTLAIGTGGIDLSVGSVMAFASATTALYFGYGELAAIMITILAVALLGLFNGSLIAFAKINPLITGLSLMVAIRGLAQAVTGGSRTSLPSGGVFTWLGKATMLGVPVIAIFAGLLSVALALFLRHSLFGRYALFAGSSRSAAFLSGTPRNSVILMIYVISAVFAGIAGLMVTSRIEASDPGFIGINFELTAIAAVVIGGTPLTGGKINILGTVVAAIFLQLIDTTFVMQGIDFALAQILKALLIVAALYMQQHRKVAR